MTYGDHAGAIRDELTVLLSYHRIQQRIGGNGIHTVPATTTAAEREVMGQVIRRYRHAVLVWCSQALRAVSVKAEPVPRRAAHQSPVDELRVCLGYAMAGGPAEPRLVDLLATDHAFELVARWQSAARAAALGEHDFTADVNRGSLNDPQLHTVVGDVATVVRALGVLDTRYAYIPGWRPLPRHPRLMQAAADVSSAVAADGVDTSVDARGWRPQPTLSSASRDAGLGGAAAAQHNVVIELGRFPTALNLRRVMHLQAQVSALAARHARGGSPRPGRPLRGAGRGVSTARRASPEPRGTGGCRRGCCVCKPRHPGVPPLPDRGRAHPARRTRRVGPRLFHDRRTHHGPDRTWPRGPHLLRQRDRPTDNQPDPPRRPATADPVHAGRHPTHERDPAARQGSPSPHHTPSHPRQRPDDESARPARGTKPTLSSRLPSYALTSGRTPGACDRSIPAPSHGSGALSRSHRARMRALRSGGGSHSHRPMQAVGRSAAGQNAAEASSSLSNAAHSHRSRCPSGLSVLKCGRCRYGQDNNHAHHR